MPVEEPAANPRDCPISARRSLHRLLQLSPGCPGRLQPSATCRGRTGLGAPWFRCCAALHLCALAKGLQMHRLRPPAISPGMQLRRLRDKGFSLRSAFEPQFQGDVRLHVVLHLRQLSDLVCPCLLCVFVLLLSTHCTRHAVLSDDNTGRKRARSTSPDQMQSLQTQLSEAGIPVQSILEDDYGRVSVEVLGYGGSRRGRCGLQTEAWSAGADAESRGPRHVPHMPRAPAPVEAGWRSSTPLSQCSRVAASHR